MDRACALTGADGGGVKIPLLKFETLCTGLPVQSDRFFMSFPRAPGQKASASAGLRACEYKACVNCAAWEIEDHYHLEA